MAHDECTRQQWLVALGDVQYSADATELESRDDYGSSGYGGASPPGGHGGYRCRFKLFALKVEQQPLDGKNTPDEVEFNVNATKLAEAQLEVVYSR